MMQTVDYNQVEIESFRAEMKTHGQDLSKSTVWAILVKVGDRGLAIDALLMNPRPAWLISMLPKRAAH